MHSFLLIGQSNMAGRGFIKEAREIDNSRIYTLRNGRWQRMFRPINPDRSFSGVNLAESFAEQYAKKYNVDVGLICCADGGTKLDQWQPGELLFDNAVYNAKLAQRTSEIVGILWHQGEGDCGEEFYPTYKQRFEVMINELRKQLNLYDVPVIVGGLGDFLAEYPKETVSKNYSKVNEALKLIAANNEMTGFASSEELVSNGDNLHFNSESLYEFGLRYFKIFESICPLPKTLKTNVKEDLERTEMEKL